MSNDLNQCNFIGRLGRDPEIRYSASGDAVANFSIAVGETWTDKASGEKKENTEWVRCVAWRKLAEIIGEYLKKGSQVYISGKLKTRKWTDEGGTERYTTEIVVDRMQMLQSPREGGDRSESDPRPADRPARAETQGAAKPSRSFDDMEDDIPV